ncbi:hypothetical protein ACFTY8_41385 [Streptomyces mirabilis]|uniref:hypothetical protein n=1 Tax=Streptomyces mirabilis TaxID=68239 RepID=UPI0036350165
MTNFDKLLENNKRFAATDFREHLPEIPFIPNQQVYVLTCIDPRVDPAATLGLRLGDAIVARTVAGRANQSFLDDLAWISYLHEIARRRLVRIGRHPPHRLRVGPDG